MILAAPPAPRPRRAPPTDSRKYEAILAAAEALFGARGFQKASVEDIAAQAGVSKPLIYRYFRSKQHLFEIVVDRVISEWCEVIVAEGARATPSAAHSLRLIIRASLEFATSRDVLRGLLARESQLMLAGYSDVLDRGNQTLRGVLRDTLDRGVRRGDVRTDLAPANMADVLTEVCIRFGDRLVSGDLHQQPDGLLEAVIETLLHGVIVHRDEHDRT